ncbi:MAG: hypothetical protein GY804_12810 [Alphaproteobacteria bacterium]|nr:hypothetical protein [Alphaproteobacteria bacterium]
MKTELELNILLDNAYPNNPSISEGLEERIISLAEQTPQKRFVLFAIKPMVLQTSFCFLLAISGFLFGLTDNNTYTEAGQTDYEVSELIWGSDTFEEE